MNNNKYQPRKDPVENIRNWLLFGCIGLAIIFIIAIKISTKLSNPDRIIVDGERYLAEPIEIEMVFVQGGTFLMGCTEEQGSDCHTSETPVHEATVSSFYIGKYVITQAQWKAIMGDNPSHFKGDSLPVEQVSWNDAQKFLRRLNTATGKEYRLPTEAEWEYACRGGLQSGHYKYSGSNNLDDVAWYEENSDSITHPVGKKMPNELGIYDMSGNVWEWCYERALLYPGHWKYNFLSSLSERTYNHRRFRGGSFKNPSERCRVFTRAGMEPETRNMRIGFRVVLSSE